MKRRRETESRTIDVKKRRRKVKKKKREKRAAKIGQTMRAVESEEKGRSSPRGTTMMW